MLCTFFTDAPVTDYASARRADTKRYAPIVVAAAAVVVRRRTPKYKPAVKMKKIDAAADNVQTPTDITCGDVLAESTKQISTAKADSKRTALRRKAANALPRTI